MASKNNKDCPISILEDKSWTKGYFDYARDPCDEFRAQCFNMMKMLKKTNQKEQREEDKDSKCQEEAIPEVSINDYYDEYSISSLELQLPLLMTTSNSMCTPEKTRYIWDWLEDNEDYFSSNKLRNSNRNKQKKSRKLSNNNCNSPKVNGSKNKEFHNNCDKVPHTTIKYCNN